jgi:CelD/BcsL family acetyltransferase involved in cellulose biosynthesis
MDFTLHNEFPVDIESEWDAILVTNSVHVPFLKFGYQKIWWETRGGDEWPEANLVLITAREAGKLVGIAPLFLALDKEKNPALFNTGSIEVSDYLDLLVLPQHMEEFISGLFNFLQGLSIPPWKTLNFYNLLDSSPSLPVLRSVSSKMGWNLNVEKLEHSPCIQLPGDWETYLAGIDKKQRHEIRRKMRRAEESDIPVSWFMVEDSASLDAEIDDFLELMKNDSDKVAFLKPAMQSFLHQVARWAFDAGCLQLAFLEIGGQKAASYLSFDYLNRIWVYNSGLNREFQSFSPGWVLLGHLLQWSIERGRTEFDFMRGNEDYKYRFGAEDRFVVLAALTPPEK